jgi:hypothetical protein
MTGKSEGKRRRGARFMAGRCDREMSQAEKEVINLHRVVASFCFAA